MIVLKTNLIYLIDDEFIEETTRKSPGKRRRRRKVSTHEKKKTIRKKLKDEKLLEKMNLSINSYGLNIKLRLSLFKLYSFQPNIIDLLG